MDLSETYKKVRPACVAIALVREDDKNVNLVSFGSGVCVDKTGIIITAKHVVTGYYEQIKKEKISADKALSAPDFGVVFSRRGEKDEEAFYSRPLVITTDPKNDVAFMKISEIQGGWPYIDVPTSIKVQEGHDIATAGFPLRGWHDQRMEPNLFSGIVSRIQAQHIEGKGLKLDNLILDISVHPGNSGGPVFNAKSGELLGIVSAQRLRPVNISETINKVLAGTDDISIKTWTNIVDCVPCTSFLPYIAHLKNMFPVKPN